MIMNWKLSFRASLLACALSGVGGTAGYALPITVPAVSTINQVNTALGLNTALSGGTALAGGFATVAGLSGPALQGALTQLSSGVTVDLGSTVSLGGNSLRAEALIAPQ